MNVSASRNFQELLDLARNGDEKAAFQLSELVKAEVLQSLVSFGIPKQEREPLFSRKVCKLAEQRDGQNAFQGLRANNRRTLINWLVLALKHEWLNIRKQERRRRGLPGEVTDQADSPAEALNDREIWELMPEWFENVLSDNERAVLEGIHGKLKTLAKLADELGLSISGVATTRDRAYRKLRKELEGRTPKGYTPYGSETK